MKLQTSKTAKPMGSPSVEKDGRQPRRDNPPESKTPSLKRSRKMVLFWLRIATDPDFQYQVYSDRVTAFQERLKFQELQSALKLYSELVTDPRSRSRFLSQYSKIHPPRLRETRMPEKRTIGVGYRDKGSLRPHHTKGRDHGEDVYWSGAIRCLLPLNFPQDVWVTREEVVELCGGENIFQLTMVAIQAQTSVSLHNLYSQVNQHR